MTKLMNMNYIHCIRVCVSAFAVIPNGFIFFFFSVCCLWNEIFDLAVLAGDDYILEY